ncbi:DUF3093 domain-containing protein [Pimelobacter simplex]|nr:DUF3093 domain-containing protein [Pimelobacter simplex]
MGVRGQGQLGVELPYGDHEVGSGVVGHGETLATRPDRADGIILPVSESARYQERLRVPLRWWAQGTMLVATLWLTLIVALIGHAAWLAWVVTGLVLAGMAAWLRSYGGARVVVSDEWFRAGRARIEMSYVGTAEALDADRTRRVSGPEADARAYLLLRPYLRQSVRVEITDPADPAPYWLVSSRHPRALASALNTRDA